MMVLLRGAHAAAVRPLVETLLEGHAPGDPDAPCVRVCFSPQELLDAPVGARVVLVGAERAPEWLNIHRPVVWERELVLLLWVSNEALEHLRRNAPDFLDWVSHRIEVPWFAPERAMAELQLALTRVKWIAVAGAELVAKVANRFLELEASENYSSLVNTMDYGDVLVRGLKDDDQLWRLMIAHAEVRWSHRVVLAEPRVLPPFVWVIDARIEGWEQHARRLESLGIKHARLVAALGNFDQTLPPFARWLAMDDSHIELLRRVARARVDDVALLLALDLGLDDIVYNRESAVWADGELTPEQIDNGIHGSLRDRRLFAGYLTSMVELMVIDVLGRRGVPLDAVQDVVQNILIHLYLQDCRALREWDSTREPSFEHYLRMYVRYELGHVRSFTTKTLEFERLLAALSEDERTLLEHISNGLTTCESADVLGVSCGIVAVRRYRLSRKLRSLIEEGSRRS